MSLVSTISPEARRRRRLLLSQQRSRVRRAANTAVHELVTRSPRTVAQLLRLELTTDNVQYVGMGLQSVVIRSGDEEVVKVMQRTMDMPAPTREELICRYRTEYLALRECLPRFTIDQVVYVGVHPLISNREAVQIKQPYLDVLDLELELFPADSAEVLAQRVAALEARYPGVADQLRDFAEGSRRLCADHGLVPDINGAGNLVVDTRGRLWLVDGIPIPASRQELQERVTAQLDMLESVLPGP
jgi:hypothetical protein